MFLSDHGPVHQSDYSEFFRKQYQELRRRHDCHAACRVLARRYGLGIHAIRRYVGMRSAVRICCDCWTEYHHRRSDHRHVCDECRRERRLLIRLQRGGLLTRESRQRRSKFYSPREIDDRAARMLEDDYGMTEEDARQMVSELRDSLRVESTDIEVADWDL